MKKKILSLLTAFAMVFGIIAAPFINASANNENNPNSTTIVVHKVLMNEDDWKAFGKDAKEHDGSQITDIGKYFGKSAKEAKGVAFRIYEVKDAQEAGFIKGDDTSLEKYKSDLDANKYYKLVRDEAKNKDFFITGDNGTFEATLGEGNYRIIEDKANSTYVNNLTGSLAVPFDLKLPAGKPDGSGNFSTTDKLHIYPKNTDKKVEFDKNFAKKHGLSAITDPNTLKDVGAVIGNYEKEKTKATADIGKEIPYHAKAKLPQETFFRNLDLADTFDRGIEFKKGSMEVSYNTAADEAEATKKALTKGTDYTITETTSGFSLTFTEAGLKTLNAAAKTQDIYVDFNYKGVVTTDAVADDEMDNNITITYNHEPPKPSPDVQPKNGEINITKTWSSTEKAEKVKYVLTQDGKSVADVTFTAAQTVDKTDLDNGIKFEVTGDYSGKFTGLDNTKQYKVEEFVNGFTPKYTKGNQAGMLSIENNPTPTSITPTPPKVVTGGKKFVKVDSKSDTTPLEGTQFRIWKDGEGNKKLYLTLNDQADLATNKKAYDDAQTAYLKAIERRNAITLKDETKRTDDEKQELTKLDGADTVTGSIKQLKKDRDEKYVKLNLSWKWTETANDAYIFTSNKNGGFEVKGLAWSKDKDGKTTNYYLEETKAPAGYELPSNKDKVATFVVGKDSYNGPANGDTTTHLDYKLVDENNTVQGRGQRVQNIKVSIPKTGGIGSLIFIVAGVAIMTFAFVAYKRSEAREA
ncbi:pilin N-terminal domain-containing protein [Anaerococcus tetradius]|uniref:LPXTG-motif cell wall anchor domain protein n=1 Tax=Anaerococcus tetradius ATCC 35098 TaxID=525255 RepID=C2CKD1_9FIRM|nr:LPXTG cell wall anchor domain-containing protein [Anaerococcus tetradius]EEI81896.1 LPXTG-motif cell wall anchor domain protein [Anaerococcus tetradius ATCC 35098]